MRVFTVREPRGCFPSSIQLGRYFLRLYVRHAGQPLQCYRCGSIDHRIDTCPHPASYRCCFRCGGSDHLYRQCPQQHHDVSQPEEERGRQEQEETFLEQKESDVTVQHKVQLDVVTTNASELSPVTPTDVFQSGKHTWHAEDEKKEVNDSDHDHDSNPYHEDSDTDTWSGEDMQSKAMLKRKRSGSPPLSPQVNKTHKRTEEETGTLPISTTSGDLAQSPDAPP